MTGCVALRKDVYYVRLSYYDKDHIRKDKFVSTGLSGRGAKQKATAMIDSLIEKYSYLEKSDHPAKMADYLAFSFSTPLAHHEIFRHERDNNRHKKGESNFQ